MVNFLKGKHLISFLLTICILLGSCKSMNKATKGAIIGTAGGAAAGALIGKAAGNTAVGAIVGAAVGGTAGYLIGRYMDKQAAELKKDLEGAEVERVGEGIKITFHQGIQFATNSSEVTATSKTNLQDLARVLNKYDDTNILIEGHTDSTGKPEYNLTLSEKRAASVSTYLKTLGVTNARITTVGYGPDQPIADNGTAAGRKENRRVEVAIFANEKLKKKAEKGEI
ncbi:Outer membrane protein OmpA [Ohtaekwangia koreensis]|jgi:outer membrane protein OmpA-like peptidoglycan-associated protein|uniref:Outer membrane protein OmpA n=2 Tax=Ohtaekwangia koreensis TaxID=688867 RepID=A0A1T5IP36_9BACT|nr:Outer membrane protein OmpA [Ohtaekwangia koreensis]